MLILRRNFLKALIAAPVVLSMPLPPSFATGGIVPKKFYERVRAPVPTGVLLGAASTGPHNEFLHLVTLLAPHPIERVNAIFLNGINSEDDCFAGHVTIKNYLGGRTQSVIPRVFNDEFSLSETRISYSYIRLKWNPTIFSTGIPKITTDICGKKDE